MYKGTSGSLQTKDRLRVFHDAIQSAGGPAEATSKVERLNDIRRTLANLDARILATTPKSEERKKLGMLKHQLSQKIIELKASLKFVPKGDRSGFPDRFMEVAKELLPRHTYEMLHKRARELLEEYAALGMDSVTDEK